MRRAVVIVSVLLITFLHVLVAGCGFTPQNVVEHNFKQGVAGLEADLVENAPPQELYENTDFAIIVEFNNQLAYPLTNGHVTLTGLDETYFQVFPLDQSLGTLEGRSLTNPDGEQTFLEFAGRTTQLFQNAERYVGKYTLKITYDSQMEFSDTVCINPGLYGVYDGGCQVDSSKSYSGQGAPLAITQLEQIITPGSAPQAEFRFTLENRGVGRVGTVTLGDARLGSENLECRFHRAALNGKEITFMKNEQEELIVCTKPLLSQFSSYMTTITIDFKYDYEMKGVDKLVMVG